MSQIFKKGMVIVSGCDIPNHIMNIKKYIADNAWTYDDVKFTKSIKGIVSVEAKRDIILNEKMRFEYDSQ